MSQGNSAVGPDSAGTAIHRTKPFIVPTEDGKMIAEHFGHAVGTGGSISIARMVAPPHWSEPWQRPEFQEFTLVSRGKKRVELADRVVDLHAGESLMVPPGAAVRYSNPFEEEVEYWAVCVPAFSPDTVHRES
jgi:mannose-6-phosphate isomerase-like protein (cupin superfamily)